MLRLLFAVLLINAATAAPTTEASPSEESSTSTSASGELGLPTSTSSAIPTEIDQTNVTETGGEVNGTEVDEISDLLKETELQSNVTAETIDNSTSEVLINSTSELPLNATETTEAGTEGTLNQTSTEPATEPTEGTVAIVSRSPDSTPGPDLKIVDTDAMEKAVLNETLNTENMESNSSTTDDLPGASTNQPESSSSTVLPETASSAAVTAGSTSDVTAEPALTRTSRAIDSSSSTTSEAAETTTEYIEPLNVLKKTDKDVEPDLAQILLKLFKKH